MFTKPSNHERRGFSWAWAPEAYGQTPTTVKKEMMAVVDETYEPFLIVADDTVLFGLVAFPERPVLKGWGLD